MTETEDYIKNASDRELWELARKVDTTGSASAALAELRHRDFQHQEKIANKHIKAAHMTGIASLFIAIATVGLWLLEAAKALGWLC